MSDVIMHLNKFLSKPALARARYWICHLAMAYLATATVIGTAVCQSPVPGAATLHVTTREVVLDIVVTDKRGNFVDGLKKDDFTVSEDKVQQRIVYFQPPSAHTIPPNTPEVQSTTDLRNIGNAPVTILVLDELNTTFADMAYARGALEKWLQRQPTKLQQPTVLLVASDEKFALLHDYTQDREALLTTLEKHFPSYPYRMSKGGSIGPDAGTRMAMSLGSLMQIAEASGGTPGRKNIIWIGVGFPALMLDDVSGTKEAEITQAAVRTVEVMLKARATLNVIDPTEMSDHSIDMNNPENLSLGILQSLQEPTSATQSGYLNFDTFAPATGGILYAGLNDVDQKIEQAINNGANYYTISYSPANKNENDPQFRNISVLMRDPSLTATTRTGYYPDVRRNSDAIPPPPSTHDLAFDLVSAALSSVVYNGLRIEGAEAANGYKLTIPVADLQTHRSNNEQDMVEVTVMQVCFDARNNVLRHRAFELSSIISADDLRRGQVVFTVPSEKVPSGTKRIRFVVRDAVNEKIGTFDTK
jgi:VWFA-related protein